jgi:hypothetical protein
MNMRRVTLALVAVALCCASLLLVTIVAPSRAVGQLARPASPAYSTTLSATKDSYVDQAFPGTNFGTYLEMSVGQSSGNERRALVQFDLSSLPTSGGRWCSSTSPRCRPTHRSPPPRCG